MQLRSSEAKGIGAGLAARWDFASTPGGILLKGLIRTFLMMPSSTPWFRCCCAASCGIGTWGSPA
eukprot:7829666-Alexandrium_andersonii.AAC.1